MHNIQTLCCYSTLPQDQHIMSDVATRRLRGHNTTYYLRQCHCWVGHPTQTTLHLTDWERLPRRRRSWQVWSDRTDWSGQVSKEPERRHEPTGRQGSRECCRTDEGTTRGWSLSPSEIQIVLRLLLTENKSIPGEKSPKTTMNLIKSEFLTWTE